MKMPPAPLVDRGTPIAFTAHPRTLREQLRYLEQDAKAILANPSAHQREELAWAADMLCARQAEARR
jgi:hypothetical protein